MFGCCRRMNSLKDTTSFDIDALVKFFDPVIQEGRGTDVYQPTYRRQRGSGLGSIFATIGRWLIPFAKKHILPNAIDMGKKVIDDVIVNKANLGESIKERGIEALKSTARSVMGQSGSGRLKRRRSSSSKKVQTGKGRKRRKVVTKRRYKSIKRRSCYD